MDSSSSDTNSEEYHQAFPGTAEQAKQFREWITETDPWLHFYHVNRWMRNNTDVILKEGEEIPIVREALCHIARDLQKKHSPNATIRLPGYGRSLEWMPSAKDRFPVIITNEGLKWTAQALLIRELCMLKLVEEITNKPDWWNKVRDAHITCRWKQEILELDWGKYVKYADFTSSMAEWCIEELKLKADLYEMTGIIPILDCSACVIKSDNLVSNGLKDTLATVAFELKGLTKHCGGYGGELKVNMAHPSLCPLIYGRSRILPNRTINLTNCLEACGEGDILHRPRNPGLDVDFQFPLYDDTYQWLPFEVTVDDSGNAKIDSYISNLHPVKHAKLYSIIEKAINHALPAWDIVYRWPHQFSLQRIPITKALSSCTVPKICGDRQCRPSNISADMGIHMGPSTIAKAFTSNVNENMRTAPFTPSKVQRDQLLNLTLERNESEVTTSVRDMVEKGVDFCCQGIEAYREGSSINEWVIDTHPIQLPEPIPSAQHLRLRLSDVRSSAFFPQKNKRLQVIVKFTEIHLSPKDPEYEGGVWLTDGHLNEHIVSTALFCYGIDNITDSYLYFGAVVNDEFVSSVSNSEEDVRLSTLRTFGIFPSEKHFQVIGRVRAHPDNAIFYPNIYKHRQGSFSLVDRSRWGYCKVLKLLLVDPAIPIISTSNIPPQQSDWWTKSKVHNQGLDIVQRLPPELKRIIHNYVDFPFDDKDAWKVRREVKRRRSSLGDVLHYTPWDQPESEDEGLHDNISNSN
ncbi:hypothetical protein ACHAQJ_007273 [Trichoderma viride]